MKQRDGCDVAAQLLIGDDGTIGMGRGVLALPSLSLVHPLLAPNTPF